MFSAEPMPVVPSGEKFIAKMPATLELTDHARLGIEHFTNIVDGTEGEMYFLLRLSSESSPTHHITSLGCCQAKALEAITWLRADDWV